MNGRRALNNCSVIDGVYVIFIAACVTLPVTAKDDRIKKKKIKEMKRENQHGSGKNKIHAKWRAEHKVCLKCIML